MKISDIPEKTAKDDKYFPMSWNLGLEPGLAAYSDEGRLPSSRFFKEGAKTQGRDKNSRLGHKNANTLCGKVNLLGLLHV